jgi:hypothetical protein
MLGRSIAVHLPSANKRLRMSLWYALKRRYRFQFLLIRLFFFGVDGRSSHLLCNNNRY